MIQFDIAITTKQIVPATNQVDPSVPQWMAGDGGPDVGDGPLGDGLQKEYFPLFRILPQYHQVGCVNLKWKANAAGGHHGQLSRGVHSTKCYVTVAHNVRHHMLYIPSGNAKDVLENIKTIQHGKRMIYRLRDLSLTMLHPTIVKTYAHRCEVVFKSRAPLRNEFHNLPQILENARFVRTNVLPAYNVAPVPYEQLPKAKGLQTVAITVAGQLTRELEGHRKTLRLTDLFSESKMVYMRANIARLLVTIGVSGPCLARQFMAWLNSDTNFDPDGWKILHSPPDWYLGSWKDLLDRDGMPKPNQAALLFEEREVRAREVAGQPPQTVAHLAYLFTRMVDKLRRRKNVAKRMLSHPARNPRAIGGLGNFGVPMFDYPQEDEDFEEDLIEANEGAADIVVEMDTGYVQRVAPTPMFVGGDDGELEGRDEGFPDMDSHDWWKELTQHILDVENAKDPVTIDDIVRSMLENALDESRADNYWVSVRSLITMARSLDITLTHRRRRRVDVIDLLAIKYDFGPHHEEQQSDGELAEV